MDDEKEKNTTNTDAANSAKANMAQEIVSDPDKNEEQSNSVANDENKRNGTTGTNIIHPNIQACIFAGLAIIGTAFLLFGVIGENQILDRLSNLEHARGLITFILTVGTISIAILVTLGALMGRDEKARERFYRAKEILTILIGVLGTIVGFYFGSQESVAGRVDLRVATPILSAYNVSSGDTFTLTSFVNGGNPPYNYKISFQDSVFDSVDGYTDGRGWISETIQAPNADKKETIQYSLKVTDANKETASYVSTKGKHIIFDPRG